MNSAVSSVNRRVSLSAACHCVRLPDSVPQRSNWRAKWSSLEATFSHRKAITNSTHSSGVAQRRPGFFRDGRWTNIGAQGLGSR